MGIVSYMFIILFSCVDFHFKIHCSLLARRLKGVINGEEGKRKEIRRKDEELYRLAGPAYFLLTEYECEKFG